jgi:hypothetical protein
MAVTSSGDEITVIFGRLQKVASNGVDKTLYQPSLGALA